jgi:hypothetical protein
MAHISFPFLKHLLCASSSPLATPDKGGEKPLSTHPVPVLTTTGEVEAGPSTPTLGKRTRGAKKKSGVATSAEPITVDGEDGTPVAKKKQKAGSNAV